MSQLLCLGHHYGLLHLSINFTMVPVSWLFSAQHYLNGRHRKPQSKLIEYERMFVAIVLSLS